MHLSLSGHLREKWTRAIIVTQGFANASEELSRCISTCVRVVGFPHLQKPGSEVHVDVCKSDHTNWFQTNTCTFLCTSLIIFLNACGPWTGRGSRYNNSLLHSHLDIDCCSWSWDKVYFTSFFCTVQMLCCEFTSLATHNSIVKHMLTSWHGQKWLLELFTRNKQDCFWFQLHWQQHGWTTITNKNTAKSLKYSPVSLVRLMWNWRPDSHSSWTEKKKTSHFSPV